MVVDKDDGVEHRLLSDQLITHRSAAIVVNTDVVVFIDLKCAELGIGVEGTGVNEELCVIYDRPIVAQ
jgi:hypothetical protein